ncbi:MAG: hypothetical protein ABIL09_02595 [Gemmatimonadota bacterium]
MRLRPKILSGFIILALMLLVAGAWSVHELNQVGSSVQSLLEDNYRSIEAAKTMMEAVERQDSAVLLLMHGRWDEGRGILTAADSLFSAKLAFADGNITVAGERECLDSLRLHYAAYRQLWQRPIVDTAREGNLRWYFEVVHDAFSRTKADIVRLMGLNDASMYGAATELEARAHRAVMPGIIAIVAALVFTALFNFFINYYVIGPIVRITRAARAARDRRAPIAVTIDSDDELRDLAAAVADLHNLTTPGR